jgi:hypothetical protein
MKLKRTTLPQLPSRLLGYRKDIKPVKVISTKTKDIASTPTDKKNSSALSLVNLKFPGHKAKNGEESCHKGSLRYPECISGLHLLEPIYKQEEAEIATYTNSSYFSLEHLHHQLHEHHKKYHYVDGKFVPHRWEGWHIVIVVALMLVVSWLRDNNLFPMVLGWGSQLISYMKSILGSSLKQSELKRSVELVDAAGNVSVGSLKVTTEKLGHG